MYYYVVPRPTLLISKQRMPRKSGGIFDVREIKQGIFLILLQNDWPIESCCRIANFSGNSRTRTCLRLQFVWCTGHICNPDKVSLKSILVQGLKQKIIVDFQTKSVWMVLVDSPCMNRWAFNTGGRLRQVTEMIFKNLYLTFSPSGVNWYWLAHQPNRPKQWRNNSFVLETRHISHEIS